MYLRVTPALIVACSSVSRRLIKAWEEFLRGYMENVATNLRYNDNDLNND